MTFNEYQRGVMRTASDVTKATKENMLMNGILGTAGEAGELVDLLKSRFFRGIHLIKSILSRSVAMCCIIWHLLLRHLVPLLRILQSKTTRNFGSAILTASRLKIRSIERKGIFNVCSYSPRSGISFQHLYADLYYRMAE